MKRASTLAGLVCLTVPGAILAGPVGQATTPPGGVFVGVCAGSQYFGSDNWAGDAYNNGASDQYIKCNTASSGAGGSASVTVSNSGSFYGYTFDNSATSFGSPGLLHTAGQNIGSNSTDFSGAVGNVGYNDITPVGGGSGSGLLVLPFWVDGTLSATGPGSSARLQMTAYENNVQIDAYGVNTAAFNLFNSLNNTHNGDIYSSWDREAIEWGTSGDDITSMTVKQFVDFVFPVTFGQPLNYGIYAQFWLTQSSGAFGGADVESANFANTFAYAGGAYVLQGTNKITDLTFNSAAGIDYSQSLVASPEPATFGFGFMGVAGLFALRRRRA